MSVERVFSGALSQSPFVRLNALLADIKPEKEPINLTVGEPKHPPPAFVSAILSQHHAEFGRYPNIAGTPEFRESVTHWLQWRFKLAKPLQQEAILPLNGSREGLFSALIFAASQRQTTEKNKIFVPNPYYPVYTAPASALGLKPYIMPSRKGENYLPQRADMSEDMLRSALAVIIASPANPQGGVGSKAYWTEWLKAAQAFDFMLFSDECYSEIYRDTPPISALEAAESLGSFRNLVIFNSLSKRSSLAGLRCGFAVGDITFMEQWKHYRNISAPQVPIPIQAVASFALGDEQHVQENRALYNEKFSLAREILSTKLNVEIPSGGFFLWLNIGDFGDGETVAVKLWQQQGVRVLPGSYLSASSSNGMKINENFIRVALVEDMEKTKIALQRLCELK